jgi:uncharacterized protein YciI
MIFVLHCRVLPGQVPRLPQFRAQHGAHAASSPIKILAAGPTLPDEGGDPIGGVYVFEAESPAVAEAFYAGDPYVREGIWTRTLLERFDRRV